MAALDKPKNSVGRSKVPIGISGQIKSLIPGVCFLPAGVANKTLKQLSACGRAPTRFVVAELRQPWHAW
jgi:hypothetical protein